MERTHIVWIGKTKKKSTIKRILLNLWKIVKRNNTLFAFTCAISSGKLGGDGIQLVLQYESQAVLLHTYRIFKCSLKTLILLYLLYTYYIIIIRWILLSQARSLQAIFAPSDSCKYTTSLWGGARILLSLNNAGLHWGLHLHSICQRCLIVVWVHSLHF